MKIDNECQNYQVALQIDREKILLGYRVGRQTMKHLNLAIVSPLTQFPLIVVIT